MGEVMACSRGCLPSRVAAVQLQQPLPPPLPPPPLPVDLLTSPAAPPPPPLHPTALTAQSRALSEAYRNHGTWLPACDHAMRLLDACCEGGVLGVAEYKKMVNGEVVGAHEESVRVARCEEAAAEMEEAGKGNKLVELGERWSWEKKNKRQRSGEGGEEEEGGGEGAAAAGGRLRLSRARAAKRVVEEEDEEEEWRVERRRRWRWRRRQPTKPLQPRLPPATAAAPDTTAAATTTASTASSTCRRH